MSSLWLMYHDVHGGRPCPEATPTAAKYHLPQEAFAAHLAAIRDSGLEVVSARDFLREPSRHSVVITFDDGWRGTFDFAVPLLAAHGWPATIYVTRDFIGQPGFADAGTLRAAARQGMEIGVHGTTHRMFSTCNRREMLWEFSACRERLEEILQEPVISASQPGGDWSEASAACAREAGLQTLGTSRPLLNGPETSPLCLGRVPIRAGTPPASVARWCRFNLGFEMFRWGLFEVPRRVLGMDNYARLRRWAIDG